MWSESGTPISDERRARAVAELVDALERGESGALARACREHPDLTSELREAAETMESLRSLPMGRVARGAAVGPDMRIAHFRVLEEIGRGGMGIVFRARDENLGREVALKWLASPLVSKGRFEAEASALAKIHHPHIVPIYEIVESESGSPAFAMELIDGESLEKIVDRAIESGKPQHDGRALLPLGSKAAPTPGSYERGVASLIAKVADGLEHAHQKQLIHRDVKPANILVDRRGEPHLIDFGLVRDLKLASTARGGRGPGTAPYMAPEQIDGNGAAIDARTDVYSLGVTLYEALALRRAFAGATTSEIDHKILERDPPALRSLRPGIARDLETICSKAMEKSPARRYASAGELRDDLVAFLEDRPIAARSAGIPARLAKWAKRNPWPAGLGALAAASLLLASWAGIAALHEEEARIQQIVADARSGPLTELRRRIERIHSDSKLYAWIAARAKSRTPTNVVETTVLLEFQTQQAEHRKRIPALHTQLSEILAKLEPRWRDTPAVAELKTDYDFERWREAKFSKDAMMERELAETVDGDLRMWRSSLTGGEAGPLVRFTEESARLDSLLNDDAMITFEVDPPQTNVALFRYYQQSQVKPGGDSRLVPVLCPPHSEPNHPPCLGPGAKLQPKFYPGDPALYLEETGEGSATNLARIPPGAPIVEWNGRPVAEAVFVRAVDPAGAAAKVGIRPWDALTRLGGAPVTDWGNTVGFLGSVPKGAPYVATFLRGATSTDLRLVRGEGLEADAGLVLARADGMLDVKLAPEGLAVRYALADGSYSDTKIGDTKIGDTKIGGTKIGGEAALDCDGVLSACGVFADPALGLPSHFDDYPIPTGKYLCVLSCVGFGTVRIPFEARGGARVRIQVALLARAEIPSGFVPVAGGDFLSGGDPEVRRPEPLTTRHVEPFWISRYEITTAQYEEFLNDPETLAKIETRPCRSGGAEPVAVNRVPRHRTNEGVVTPLWPRVAGRFVPAWDRRLPVRSISWYDAKEYCDWLTKKTAAVQAGWVFDLPTSDEWECAARGADARKFPWGREFCWRFVGAGDPRSWPARQPKPVGAAIYDESPYGVRDMAGNALEWTSTEDPEGQGARTYRGGYFEAGEDEIQCFRSAFHAPGQTERPGDHDGFRVVARRTSR